jgi:hypothetical protein
MFWASSTASTNWSGSHEAYPYRIVVLSFLETLTATRFL